jgi:dolichol-phosphate mannosyltransferase
MCLAAPLSELHADDRISPLERLSLHSPSVKALLLLVAIAFVLRLLMIAFVPLMPEEAYYWMYSQHPSLSYFDHPPMVAWMIFAGTWAFRDTETGVRICGNLLATASIILMYSYARIWMGRRAALGSALILLILPFYVWTGFIATMDSQLMFFWLVCLIGASLALRREKWWGWYLAGAGFGGALLSKYTGIFVGGGLLLALFAYQPWRKYLRSPHPYIGAAIGLAMFTPVILWNAHHDWASFRFQFLDRSEIHPLLSWRSLVSPINFAGLQLVEITPVFAMAAISLVVGRRRLRNLLRRPQPVFALCAAAPLIACMAWKSVTYDVHIDWTAPAYLSLFPLVCGRWMSYIRLSLQRKWFAWPASAMITLVGCVGFNLLGPLYLLLLMPRTGHPQVFGPWHPLAILVQRYEVALEDQTHREPLIIGRGKYRLASELAFYRSEMEKPESSSANTTSQWFLGDIEGLGFSYWINPLQCRGRDCIYVTDKDDIKSVVEPRFEQVRMIDDPALRKLPGGVVYHMAICTGFKG